MQRLELLVTLMLLRERDSPTDHFGGGQHTEFGAAVMSIPSGLLAMIGEAILKLECEEVRAIVFRSHDLVAAAKS